MTPTGWRLVPSDAVDEILVDADEDSRYQRRLGDPDPLQNERLIEMVERCLFVADCRRDGRDLPAPTDHEWRAIKQAELASVHPASHRSHAMHEMARAVLALFRGEGK